MPPLQGPQRRGATAGLDDIDEVGGISSGGAGTAVRVRRIMGDSWNAPNFGTFFSLVKTLLLSSRPISGATNSPCVPLVARCCDPLGDAGGRLFVCSSAPYGTFLLPASAAVWKTMPSGGVAARRRVGCAVLIPHLGSLMSTAGPVVVVCVWCDAGTN